MSSLSLQTQKAIMKNLSYRRLETSDYWEYAVSRSWLDSWIESLSKTISAEDDKDSIGSRLRPVTIATNSAENEYLPESQWRIYVDWFGLDSAHDLRRRPIYSMYMSLESSMNLSGDFVIADNELDVLPIYSNYVDKLVTSSDNNQVLSVYAWDNFTYICKQVKSVLAIKKSTSVRLWFCLLDTESTELVVIEPIMAEEQTLLSKLIEIAPSVRSVMKRRNTQLNPKYIIQGKGKGIERRACLWDDISVELKANKPCIAIGVEIVGRRVHTIDSCVEEEMFDSIVTISSIRNEWEDLLAQNVEKYTDDMSESTVMLKEKLVNSAKVIVGEKMEEINEIRADYEKRFAMLEERETSIRTKENENNEKEAHLASRLSNYIRGLDDLQKQKKKFDEDVGCIKELNQLSESRIVLNVGGIVYTTSIATLTKNEGSLLSSMFSGSHALKREADGSYFIDRDGVNFRFILNYLRDGSEAIEALQRDDKIIKEVIIEANYYKLVEMVKLLQAKLL